MRPKRSSAAATAASICGRVGDVERDRVDALGSGRDEVVERVRAARRGDDAIAVRERAPRARWRPKPEELPVIEPHAFWGGHAGQR